MQVKSAKLRRFTLGTQFLAGIGLLTASYMTTDADWTEQLVKDSTTVVQLQKVSSKIELKGGC